MGEGFDKTNEHIDHLEIKVDKIEVKVDKVVAKLDKFEEATNKRFDNVENSIKDLKSFTMEGFIKMEEYIDKSKIEMEQKITTHFDRRLNEVKTEIIGSIKTDLIKEIHLIKAK